MPALGSPGKKLPFDRSVKISVLVPCRNEEHNIAGILDDLSNQDIGLYEIICSDDASNDNTADIAISKGAFLVKASDKPDEWMGKSWACRKAAEASTGDILLFIDADVRLAPDAVRSLLIKMNEVRCVLSVQPYHTVIKPFEQMSLFPNLVQLAANGMGKLFRKWKIGLYGPVIMMTRSDYFAVGGHSSVKDSVIEDVAFGSVLKQNSICFENYCGGSLIRFRMYPEGLVDLYHGWTKNMSSGAVKTPLIPVISVILWITSQISVCIKVFQGVAEENLGLLLVSVALYLLWVASDMAKAKHTGNFSVFSILFYPLPLTCFVIIFMVSVLRKIFRISSVWKGRKIR